MSVKVGSVTVDTSKLDAMGAGAKRKAGEIIEKYGFMIAQSASMRAPYLTGNLKSKITASSKMIAPLTYRVSDGTEYGLRLELGFVGEDKLGRQYNQAARPFMFPALEQYRQKFINAFAELFK